MATICLGLLIAIALEQGVEWLHHRYELKELHEALRRDTEKQIQDARYYEDVATFQIGNGKARMQQAAEALRDHQPIAKPVLVKDRPPEQLVFPVDPAWKAATASGLLVLVPQQDIVAYTEIDGILANSKENYDRAVQANLKLRRFEKEIALEGDPAAPPFSKATPEDLKTYMADLDEMISAFNSLRGICKVLRGADAAILSGERDLGKIEESENQFLHQP
jgi:hypothetical protein